MREKSIESKLARETALMGGMAVKFVSPGLDGVPDRLLLLPDGKIAFAEVKAPGQLPRPIQALRMRQLRKLGFRVYVIDGVEQIKGVLDEVRTS